MDCFVVSPIGESGSEIRRESDDIFDYIIREALEPIGFTVGRADRIDQSGIITSQIVEKIVTADLVVAVLTNHNANVFYELAIRHMVGKPFIHMMADGEKLPFDVSASRTIFYSLDLSGAKRAQKELREQATAFVSGGAKVESPISVAIDLKALHSSEDPTSTALSKIEHKLTRLRLEVSEFSNLIGSLSMPVGSDGLIRIEPSSEAVGKFGDIYIKAPAGRVSGWTDEKVAVLREMWGAGKAASEIGRELGVPRNAVLGKIHKLGLARQVPPDESEE